MSATPLANKLSRNLKWAAGLVWVQFIFSCAATGLIAYAYIGTDIDTSDIPIGSLVAIGIAVAITLATAIYLTVVSVKAGKQRHLALPLGSATGGHGIALITIGTIYLLLVVTSGIINIVSGNYVGVGSVILGAATGGCMIGAGVAARNLNKAYRSNPMATDTFNGQKMNMNNVGPTGYMPSVPMQPQQQMYGMPQQQQQFTGYVPVNGGQWQQAPRPAY